MTEATSHVLRTHVGTLSMPIVRFDQRGGEDGLGGEAFSRGVCMREARREEGLHLVSGSGYMRDVCGSQLMSPWAEFLHKTTGNTWDWGLGGPSQPGSPGFSGRALPCLSNIPQLLAKVRLLFRAAFA